MSERITAAAFRAGQAAEGKTGFNKFGAQPTTVDGIRFDSLREARRWGELRLMEKAGEIVDLRRQVPVELQGRDGPLLTRTGRCMRLTIDFAYTDSRSGLTIYEDAKGMPTRDYEVRRAVAAAQGVNILEV